MQLPRASKIREHACLKEKAKVQEFKSPGSVTLYFKQETVEVLKTPLTEFFLLLLEIITN